MKNFILFLVATFPFVAFGAPDYASGPTNSRVGVYGRAGPAPTGRPTVPVTTTTTTTTSIPETNLTSETKTTVNVEIDAARNACLSTYGNVWASKFNSTPGGVPATTPMAEDPDPNNNVCFAVVSVKSDEIKNLGRFFPPRYFQTGVSLECGSWLDTAALDEAILDSKKGARTGWTIAASVVGAGAGFGLSDLLGQKVIKRGFNGQYDLDDKTKEFYIAMKKDTKHGNDKKLEEYARAYKALGDACGWKPNDAKSQGTETEYCKHGQAAVYNTLVEIGAI
jgi:hypothetical protein